jgi:cytochrome c peroxidase
VVSRYATQYAAVFGATPDLSDASRFPASGAPGSASWRAMTAGDQDTINRVFSNVGKAIEAYERTLTVGPTVFDAYVAGNMDAMTLAARDGLQEFMQSGCAQCHYGPRLTDDTYHNIGMPTGRQDGLADLGRIDAINTLLASPFNVNGRYSDASDPQRYVGLVPDAAMLGAFRTPTLRGTSMTGPWGHGGTFTSLHDVMYHYARRGMLPPAPTSAGVEDWHLPSFHYDDPDLNSLVSFMDALSP